MSFNSLLNKTGIIYRKTRGSVNSFGETSFTENQGDTINIAIQPVRETLEFHIAGTIYVATEVVYCALDEDIQAGDYLEVSGVKYLVLAVSDDAGRQHHLRCYVRSNV